MIAFYGLLGPEASFLDYWALTCSLCSELGSMALVRPQGHTPDSDAMMPLSNLQSRRTWSNSPAASQHSRGGEIN